MSSSKVTYAADLVERAERDPAFEQQLKEDPVAALKSAAATPLDSDVWIYRIVVISLGAALIITLLAASALAACEKSFPEGLIAIGAAAGGALAGLLAPSPARRS
ncbi:MAG: hypothetical protein M3552_14775 [Planctomycetota bacterium]|nr:hypothetical protein [Planctomycetota bacterium]